MQSKLAKEARRALVAQTRRMSPEQRLEAFLVHCRLVTELREARPQAHRTVPQS